MPGFYIMWTELIILFLTGCIGGLLSGLLGIGGGVIYVVVFQTWLEYHLDAATMGKYFVQIIILNSLVAIIFSALSGLWRQSKYYPLDIRMICSTGFPAALAAIFSTILVTSQTWYQRDIFLLIFTLLLLPMLLRFIPSRYDSGQKSIGITWLVSGGILAGMATALSGLGGGVVLHPYLHGLGKLDIRKTLPLALGVMLFSSLSIVAYHLINGHLLIGIKGIIPALVIPVAVGNMLTAPLGVKLSHRLSVRTIKWIFIVFTLLLVSRNLYLIFSS